MLGSARGREGKLVKCIIRKKGGLGGQNAAQYTLLCLDTVRIFVAFPETFEIRLVRLNACRLGTFATSLHFRKSEYSIGQPKIGRLVRTYVGSMKPIREYGNY